MILRADGPGTGDKGTSPGQPSHAAVSRRTWMAGYAALALFAGTIGVWGGTAALSGAVIASGQFVVDGNVKKVQHQTGGVVGELRVREGDRVEAGDLLIRLDATVARANLQIIVRQLDEFAARSARLEAERDQAASLTMPERLASRLDEPDVAQLITAEERLFTARATARDGLRAQLSRRIGQLRSEIEGLTEQRSAKLREAELIKRELTGVRELFRQNLVQITRLSQLEREAASLDGQKGQLTAQIAQSEGRIAETELQILQLNEDLRAEVMKELREIQGRTGELNERRFAAEDQLKRIDVRARDPFNGTMRPQKRGRDFPHVFAAFLVEDHAPCAAWKLRLKPSSRIHNACHREFLSTRACFWSAPGKGPPTLLGRKWCHREHP